MRYQRGQPGRRRVGWLIAACSTIGVIGAAALTWLGVTAIQPHEPASGLPVLRASAGGPLSPPVRVCGSQAILGRGPATRPRGAVTLPTGDNSAIAQEGAIRAHTTYWFAPGKHTLGSGQFTQIVPKNGDRFIGAPGAIIDGQHQNLYAFTGTARDVQISYLTIQNFGKPGDNGGEGVVNHDMGQGWRISHVTVQHSAGAGVMVGTNGVLSWSCLRDNGEYGFQGVGDNSDPRNITVDHNEVTGNNIDNWEKRNPGCGCTGGAKFWRVDGATVTYNWVHDNHGPGLWADTDNRGFYVADNYFSDNEDEGFIYEISYNLRLADNTFVRNALAGGPKLGGFPKSAVYISESGSDRRVRSRFSDATMITGNVFTDNWSGVVLWESADRFCGSPVNTSTGDCTLVSPRAINTHSCDAQNIRHAPYYADCRWRTQNVVVRGNDFTFSPAHIGSDCTAARYCGFNGIFSQFGTQPSWSPYHGEVIENDIAFRQHNRFTDNSYAGPWRFMIHTQGNVVPWAQWRAAPYRQDQSSTLTPEPATR
jgi:Right handed beta helix region